MAKVKNGLPIGICINSQKYKPKLQQVLITGGVMKLQAKKVAQLFEPTINTTE